jgi:small-conductance mechanosensitive channel
MIIAEWADTITQGFQQFGGGFIRFVPSLIASIVIFLIGWFVAIAIGKLIVEILKKLKLDSYLDKTGWKEAMEKVDMKMTMSEFIGGLCKWILILLFLGMAANILNLNTFSVFILSVVSWLPKLVVAVLMFIVIVVFSNIAEKAVKATMNKAKLDYVDLAGSIVRWAIWVFGILAILMQLGVMTELIMVMVQGFVFMVAGAAALAFGLGGKDVASDLLHSIKNKIKK